MRLTRDQLRQRTRALRALVNRHDPFGLIAAGAPDDEYDDIVGPLLRHLEAEASAAAIAQWLKHEMGAHYGCRPARAEHLAADATQWFTTEWPGSESVPLGDV